MKGLLKKTKEAMSPENTFNKPDRASNQLFTANHVPVRFGALTRADYVADNSSSRKHFLAGTELKQACWTTKKAPKGPV
jgi:hypothetical protein